MNVLVTGATGFVGNTLVKRLLLDGHHRVSTAGRREVNQPGLAASHVVGELGPTTDWKTALQGIEVVIHLAARVHVMRDTATDPLTEFRRVNTEGTERLATQAIVAGARRFIYVSSIKVNGEQTADGRPFLADDRPNPVDPYGVSKHEAETTLRKLDAPGSFETVIVRPPLVYGSGVKANFAALIRAVSAGVPLPLGAIQNRRSLISVDNLVDLLSTCVTHPAAAGQTFLASDDEDVSTSELIRRLGHALERPARLVPIPVSLLLGGARLFGKMDAALRLCGSLQVDVRKTRSLLSWKPPLSLDQGLRRTVWCIKESTPIETAP